jgi:hypothetical protein
LQGDQVLHRVNARLKTGGDQARQPTGNVSTVLGFVKQRILPLPNEQLQGALAQVIVDGGAGDAQKSTPIMMPQCLIR